MDNSGMPSGEANNPSGQSMPVDGGPGSSPTPAPGEVASPGSDEYDMTPSPGGGEHNSEAYGIAAGGQRFASLPTPDN